MSESDRAELLEQLKAVVRQRELLRQKEDKLRNQIARLNSPYEPGDVLIYRTNEIIRRYRVVQSVATIDVMDYNLIVDPIRNDGSTGERTTIKWSDLQYLSKEDDEQEG